jgi:isopenicillin-N epimerase
MQSRREFIGAISVPAACAAAGLSVPAASAEAAEHLPEIFARTHASPDEAARDQDFWSGVAAAFTVDRSMVNLNNGGVSPAPATVQSAVRRHWDFANAYPPAHALWRVQDMQLPAVHAQLARVFGGTPDELAITRNASESLQTCLFGMDLKRGDEVLTTTQDYPRMINTLKQRERREGIVLRQIKIPVPAEDPAELVSAFERSITPRTRMILISHVINLTGQIMPVRQIVAMARRHEIQVIVDGAHALAHLDYKITDTDCDYYGVSLHKWLFAPHGTGLLYVRKDKIKGLWPLMAAAPEQEESARKFEEIGTHPAASYLAIADAIAFHEGLGATRKLARMVHLRSLWMDRLAGSDRIRLHTSRRPELACGIGNMQIEGVDSTKLGDWLWDKHRILVTAIKHEEFEGIRVTPSVYTLPAEIDRFCEAMETVVAKGLPT